VSVRGDGYNVLLALGDSFARNPQDEAYYGEEELKPLTENFDDLREGGVIIYDEGIIDNEQVEAVGLPELAEENDWHVYPVDLRSIAKEHGREVMRNNAGIGVMSTLLDFDTGYYEDLMAEVFPDDVAEANRKVIQQGAETATEFDHRPDFSMPDADEPEARQALVSGSDAIAYGALDAGCRFISGYPMTPWTDVFTIMSQNLPKFGGVSEQVEDEIAAASLAIGASYAGVKAMSGSSGGGFALMSEPLGLAEMTETPLVLLEAMRAGPSTGMPTKPEQGDLEHVLYTSQGDSTRVVLAPGNIRECYEQIRAAFEVAYEYQIPTVLVYDQKLQGELRNVDRSFFDREPDADPGSVMTEAEIEEAARANAGAFKRHRYDGEKGISPRSVPGQKGGRFLTTGNEHNEAGHISEDPHNRVRQMDRRLGKLEYIREELDERGNQTYHGPDEAQYGILTWGSHQDTVFEAVDRLDETGHSVKALGVSDLAPYPEAAVTEFLTSVEECIVVEMNATGQFRGLTQKELGRFGPKLSSLLKYNGNPFEPAEIVEGFESSIGGEELGAANMKYVPAAGD
jgi:pyruvate ferredoxin oxidoreductase alpha subunit